MANHERAPIALTLQETTRRWTAEEIPVLEAAITLPHFAPGDAPRAAARLNRYYAQCLRAFVSYCNRELYPSALADWEAARRRGAPLPCARASLTCTVACHTGSLLSLYLDCTEWTRSPEALTLRRADVWDLRCGTPIRAQDCFPPGARLRKRFLEAARSQYAQRRTAGMVRSVPHWQCRLRRYLNPRNFYLGEDGLYFFYQPYTIAASGMECPTFFLPFSAETGPFPPPDCSSCQTEKSVV